MVDAEDLKSFGSNTVWVRVPPWAPLFLTWFSLRYIIFSRTGIIHGLESADSVNEFGYRLVLVNRVR
jgi:hypothetical protein